MLTSRRSNVRRSNLTACARCKSRKQRCDQSLPACAACERAGVACVSFDLDGRALPRSYTRSLEDRVAHLEKCLISHGIHDYDREPSESSTAAAVAVAIAGGNTAASKGTGVVDLTNASVQSLRESDSMLSSSPPASGDLPSQLIRQLLLPYLGQPEASCNNIANPVDTNPSEYEQLLKELPRDAELPMPAQESASKLICAYFEHSDFFSPILHREQLQSAVDMMYQDLAMFKRPHPRDEFRVCMVFAIAIRLLNRADPSLPLSKSNAYFSTGARLLVTNQEILGGETLHHLEALLLIIQYQSFESNLRGVWHFIGLATRLAVHLGLHNERHQSTIRCLSSDELVTRNRLFWATYTFERNLCPVLSRPFSIPDEAIETSLPTVVPGPFQATQALAVHLVKVRQLESEIYTTLHQKPHCNGAFLNYVDWRLQMRRRLHQWYSETPPSYIGSSLAPAALFEGLLVTSLVQLYYPSHHLPNSSDDDICWLARHATRSVTTYREAFRRGTLRFYWRAMHNLFRAGAALLYCTRTASGRTGLTIDVVTAQASVGQCSNILWGMAERYPNGKAYRDAFERLIATENDCNSEAVNADMSFGDEAFNNTDWLNAWVLDPIDSSMSASSV